MGKAGGGLIRVGIYIVMSLEAPMQPASKSEAAHANYANPNVHQVIVAIDATAGITYVEFKSAVSWMFHSIFYQAQVKENVWFGKRFDEICQWI